MSDDTQPAAPAPDSPQPDNAAPPVDTGEATTPPAADASADTDANADGEGDKPQPKKRGDGVTKRIHELTAQKRELERRLAEATAPKADAGADDAPPDRSQFASYEDYIKAEARYETRQELKRHARESTQRDVERIGDERLQAFSEEMGEVATENPAFAKAWQTVTAKGYPISDAIFDFVSESDDPQPLIEYLASNRAEAAKLYNSSPAQVARALARVEAKLVSAPPARTPQAPPPPPTVGGRSAPRVDPARMSMDEYAKWRMAQT